MTNFNGHLQRYSFVFACIFMVGQFCVSQVDASAWQSYIDGRADHYFVDQQEFEDIACEVSVSMLNELIEKIDEQISEFGENVAVHTDLSAFEIRYSPKLGVRFTDPKFHIEVKSYEGVEEVQRVRRGLAMIQQGFTFSVNGIKKQLTSIVNVSIKPQEDQYENIEMTEIDGGVQYAYEFSGFGATETRKDNIIQVSQSNEMMSINSKSQYNKYENGQLVLDQTTLEIKQPVGDMSLVANMTYQTVEDIVFLNTMSVEFEQGMPSARTTGSYLVELKNCKVY